MSSSRQVRLFVACVINDEISAQIGKAQAALHSTGIVEARYTDVDMLHCTLCFIGSVELQLIPEIDAKLKSIIARPCTGELDSLKLFKVRAVPGVVVVSLNSRDLLELYGCLVDTLGTFLHVSDQTFVPHLTVARIKHVHDSSALDRFIKEYPISPHKFIVDRFCLMSSILTSSGPQHSILACYPLRGDTQRK